MKSPIFAHAATLYREMRDEFQVTLEHAYAAAEEGTGGAMLNRLGRTEPIDAFSLLTGPWSRVIRYGSAELMDWFAAHGRPSLAEFEREWMTSYLEPNGQYATVSDNVWMPLPDATAGGDAGNVKQCQRCGRQHSRAHEWTRDNRLICPWCWNDTRRASDTEASV